jgi:mannose-6-phosphate isomerase-like protein (cupin superfamily)
MGGKSGMGDKTMVNPIRRVVTGHDASGKAVVISDGPAENIIITEHRPGGRTNLWRTTSMPANYDGDSDAAGAKYNTEPVPNGTNFRINEFPPEDPEQIANVDPLKAFAVMGAAHRVVENARHPFMHRTDTVDYAIILEGEIDMLLDDEDVHLKAGDIVIQRGTNHAWSNKSDRLCRIAFILIDGADADGKKRP